jgi:hypothetical protein
MPNSNWNMNPTTTEGLRPVTREEFEAFISADDGGIYHRIEWRRIASLYHTRCEIRNERDEAVAIEDDDGNYWLR